ncbi:type I glyceraldehyde-3-phosphate dehydrogenase [Candidatus Woesearchaeota archaeon]|nr:type I glyceraldehyde-3-phosphate dehydrogenase [Candidatus Woesearchaeota archaeon]
MIRIAINGFGRIGRMILHAGYKDKKIQFVAVNDLTDTKTLAHLLKHDSVHGAFDGVIETTTNSLIINGKELKVFAEKEPEKLPWKKLKIDVVIESTGFYTTKDGAMKHVKAGAKKVLVSAPCKCTSPKNFVKTIVYGVNHKSIDKKKDIILSNASCTTNCLAPIVKILHDNFAIKKGFMTTVHAYTADQRLEDSPHKDLRRARNAALNIIPTSTGAAKTVTEVIPALKGKLDGIALRVPVADGSITDFVCELKKAVTKEEINKVIKMAAKREMKGVLEYTEEEIVSSDIVNNPASSIFDAKLTMVIDKRFVKVLAWYDNEWGYSCRMIDVVKLL